MNDPGFKDDVEEIHQKAKGLEESFLRSLSTDDASRVSELWTLAANNKPLEGYREDWSIELSEVSDEDGLPVCPRCLHVNPGQESETPSWYQYTDGCRMNGDAYGIYVRMCLKCGLFDWKSFDEND